MDIDRGTDGSPVYCDIAVCLRKIFFLHHGNDLYDDSLAFVFDAGIKTAAGYSEIE